MTPRRPWRPWVVAAQVGLLMWMGYFGSALTWTEMRGIHDEHTVSCYGMPCSWLDVHTRRPPTDAIGSAGVPDEPSSPTPAVANIGRLSPYFPLLALVIVVFLPPICADTLVDASHAPRSRWLRAVVYGATFGYAMSWLMLIALVCAGQFTISFSPSQFHLISIGPIYGNHGWINRDYFLQQNMMLSVSFLVGAAVSHRCLGARPLPPEPTPVT